MSMPVYLAVIAVWCVAGPPEAASASRYIVRFEQAQTSAMIEEAAATAEHLTGGHRGHRYRRAIRGFSIALPERVSKELLYTLPGVIDVEPDVRFFTTAQTIPSGVQRINAHRSPIANINGIDQRVDVGVAVIDTGIQPNHPDLNVVGGRRFYSEYRGKSLRSFEDDNYHDNNGHGTHVAGIIGALDNSIGVVGVAPGVRLWSLRVFNDDGDSYTSDIIAALEWVLDNTEEIEIVNFSLGVNTSSPALRTAVQNTVAEGVVIFAAAGNDVRDIYGIDGVFGTSDDFIPAAFPEVAAVSALRDTNGMPGGTGGTQDDAFWRNNSTQGSNFSASVVAGNPVNSPGAAIDLMMPGVSIYSTNINNGYTYKTGTSMASPHAAGLAALYIAVHGRAADAAGVYAIRQALIDSASGQTSPRGLAIQNDPDDFPERIGYILPADFNHDGVVDALDLLILADAWLSEDQDAAFCRPCDIHLPPDGRIDLLDLAEFTSYWLVGGE